MWRKLLTISFLVSASCKPLAKPTYVAAAPIIAIPAATSHSSSIVHHSAPVLVKAAAAAPYVPVPVPLPLVHPVHAAPVLLKSAPVYSVHPPHPHAAPLLVKTVPAIAHPAPLIVKPHLVPAAPVLLH